VCTVCMYVCMYIWLSEYVRINDADPQSCRLHECGTWSVTLRVEHRLRVFKNMVLRNGFVCTCKRVEVIGDWSK
jgi:hypothetical protein